MIYLQEDKGDEDIWENSNITSIMGTVEEVNLIYQSFNLKLSDDNSIVTVYVGNCDNLLHFPRRGDEIEITKAQRFNNACYILDGASQIITETPLGLQPSRLSYILRRHKLSAEDLRQFHCEFPEVDLSRITTHSCENVKVTMLDMVLRKQFCIPNLATTNLLYVTFGKTYKNFPYFSHGVHHNLPNQYLIGEMRTDKTGQLILTDGLTYQPLIVTCKKRYDVYKFVNKIVFLDEFVVFTEVYEQDENHQYILCDIANVHLFGAPVKAKMSFCLVHGFEGDKHTKEVIDIVIESVATPTQKASLRGQCVLGVWMRCVGKDWKNCFLNLEANSLLIVPFLDVGSCYKIFLTKPLVQYSDGELRRLPPWRPVYAIQPMSATFVPVPSIESPFLTRPFLTTSQTISVMKDLPHKATENLNFEGTLFIKSFTKADSYTRTPAYSKSIAYGTPGPKRHLLRFDDRKTAGHFTLYLNNWERSLRPIGLLSNVRLRIYNMDVSKTYAKVNALTRIEVVGYKSPIRFSTANLNSASNVLFYSSIGYGAFIPYKVLIRARATIGHWTKFIVEMDKQNTVKVQFIFFAFDGRGDALLMCSRLDFFKRLMFDNEETLYEVWLSWFQRMRYYSYYDATPRLPEELKVLHSLFHNFVKLKMESICEIEVLCRKAESTEKHDYAVWIVEEVFDLKPMVFYQPLMQLSG